MILKVSLSLFFFFSLDNWGEMMLPFDKTERSREKYLLFWEKSDDFELGHLTGCWISQLVTPKQVHAGERRLEAMCTEVTVRPGAVWISKDRFISRLGDPTSCRDLSPMARGWAAPKTPTTLRVESLSVGYSAAGSLPGTHSRSGEARAFLRKPHIFSSLPPRREVLKFSSSPSPKGHAETSQMLLGWASDYQWCLLWARGSWPHFTAWLLSGA